MFFSFFYMVAVWVTSLFAETADVVITTTTPPAKSAYTAPRDVAYHITTPKPYYKTGEEVRLESLGLVDVREYAPDIYVRLGYHTYNNILGIKLYDYDVAYLQPSVALKLSNAQKLLRHTDNRLSLIVHDAARPQHIQQKCWEFATIKGLQYLFINPEKISMHSYGVAVDVSILDLSTGKEIDMGSSMDSPEKTAAPKNEERLLREGVLTSKQITNRLLLRNLMRSAGFTPISNEWWHFEGFSRSEAMQQFKPIP